MNLYFMTCLCFLNDFLLQMFYVWCSICLNIHGTHVTANIGCLNIHGTRVTANNSTTNYNVFFFFFLLFQIWKYYSMTTINPHHNALNKNEKYYASLLIWRQKHLKQSQNRCTYFETVLNVNMIMIYYWDKKLKKIMCHRSWYKNN